MSNQNHQRLVATLLSPGSGYLWASMEILRGEQGVGLGQWAPPGGVAPGSITQATLLKAMGLPPHIQPVYLPRTRVKPRRGTVL